MPETCKYCPNEIDYGTFVCSDCEEALREDFYDAIDEDRRLKEEERR